MDAVAYQVSFDKEQLALLCANYDRCIDSLGAENKRLKAENAKLRELVRDMYKSMNISCQFSHAIPAGTMAHIKNRVIGLGVEVEQ